MKMQFEELMSGLDDVESLPCSAHLCNRTKTGKLFRREQRRGVCSRQDAPGTTKL